MYAQTFAFIAASLVLLTSCRLGLAFWQRRRVKAAIHASKQPWALLIGGLRMDALTIALFAALPLLLAPWLDAQPLAHAVNACWLTAGWLLMGLLELSTPQFILEYDSRPNRLYLVYLKHPKEVFTMLWRGYRALLAGVALGMCALAWLGWQVFAQAPQWVGSGPGGLPWQPSSVMAQILLNCMLSVGAALLGFLTIRGTLRHRPINPSTVAFCGDALVNTLALNSLYSVLYAAYSLKNERCSADVYGTLPEAQIHACVRQCAGLPESENQNDIPTLHWQHATQARKRPRHIVLIVQESLGAQFVGYLNGKAGTEDSLTPELDRLAAQSWTFTRAFATGTRSVRGLEALTAGFAPCYSEAVLKLPDAQSRFFTLAQLLKKEGYRSSFVYGGEAHFDNMKGFFLGNGFDELHDLKTFDNPAFVGTWGASDEDMFGRVHHLLEHAQQPCLILAFSVSNHSPWEYPAGRIQPVGDPRSVSNTVRYADWAMGQFFNTAQASRYWDDTVFLVAADHDARVGGQAHVPLKHFHIPALILGGGIAPGTDDRLVSQIDFPVTLLSLAGVSSQHPMIGHDLTLAHGGGRAMMQYGDSYGYLQNDVLTVLQPRQSAVQLRWQAPDTYQPIAPDPVLTQRALAHALWPGLVYRQQRYTLPHLRLALKQGASAFGQNANADACPPAQIHPPATAIPAARISASR